MAGSGEGAAGTTLGRKGGKKQPLKQPRKQAKERRREIRHSSRNRRRGRRNWRSYKQRPRGKALWPGVELRNLANSKLFLRRRQWHPTPILLPGESHGRRSLVGYSPWGCTESGMTEQLTHRHTRHRISFFIYVHVCSVMSSSLQPHRLQPARLLCSWIC